MDGQVRSGVLAADSIGEARSTLRAQGLFLLSVDAKKSASGSTSFSFGGSGIKLNDLVMLTSQLSIICRSGVDIAEAIEIILQKCPNRALKKVLQQIHNDISGGVAVSDALRTHSKVFGEAYVAGIAAGEASGKLPEVLRRLEELLKNQMQMRSTVTSVMAYPLVLTCVMFIVICVLIFFVLPQFGTVFENMGRHPPAITRMLIDFSLGVKEHATIIIGASAAALFGAWRLLKTEKNARRIDQLLISKPPFRDPVQALLTGRAFRLLGTMVQSGIPLLEGLRLCRNSIGNRVFRGLFDDMDREVVGGGSIGTVLNESEILPVGVAQMVGAAERTGQIGPVMETVGEHFEQEGEKKVRSLAKLAEPLVVVVMGVIVSGVVMSIMLPLLDVSTASKRK